MNQEHSQPPAEPSRAGQENARYLSTKGLLIVFAALAVAFVLAWFLLNKLVDMSREEDCALAHRYNCGAVEIRR